MRVSCWPAVTTMRRVVLERAVDHADGVAEAGRDMQVHEAGLAARLGVEAGGADRHAFVQMHDVLELRVVEQRIEQRASVVPGLPKMRPTPWASSVSKNT